MYVKLGRFASLLSSCTCGSQPITNSYECPLCQGYVLKLCISCVGRRKHRLEDIIMTGELLDDCEMDPLAGRGNVVWVSDHWCTVLCHVGQRRHSQDALFARRLAQWSRSVSIVSVSYKSGNLEAFHLIQQYGQSMSWLKRRIMIHHHVIPRQSFSPWMQQSDGQSWSARNQFWIWIVPLLMRKEFYIAACKGEAS